VSQGGHATQRHCARLAAIAGGPAQVVAGFMRQHLANCISSGPTMTPLPSWHGTAAVPHVCHTILGLWPSIGDRGPAARVWPAGLESGARHPSGCSKSSPSADCSWYSSRRLHHEAHPMGRTQQPATGTIPPARAQAAARACPTLTSCRGRSWRTTPATCSSLKPHECSCLDLQLVRTSAEVGHGDGMSADHPTIAAETGLCQAGLCQLGAACELKPFAFLPIRTLLVDTSRLDCTRQEPVRHRWA
jgi:hypothetical protein